MLNRLLAYSLRGIYRALTYSAVRKETYPDDVKTRDLVIEIKEEVGGGDNDNNGTTTVTLPACILEYHDAEEARKHPLLVYFHGGGGVAGSFATTHDWCTHVFASELKCTIVAIDYRLAPEHACPTGMDDCIKATQWIQQNMEQGENFKLVSNGKVVVAGDSMGGLTSIVAATAKIQPRVVGAVCFYPNTMYATVEGENDDENFGNGSWKSNANAAGLSKGLMDIMHKILFSMSAQEYHEQHKNDTELLNKVFPFTMSENYLKENMPPLFLVTCEKDILRDEGVAFGRKAEKARVAVQHLSYNQEHGFMCGAGRSEEFEDCLTKLHGWLNNF